MRYQKITFVPVMLSAFLGISVFPLAGQAHEKINPNLQPSEDWIRQSEALLSVHLENAGDLKITPLAPVQRTFLIEKAKMLGLSSKADNWSGWVGNLQVQRGASMNVPVVNYTCLLSLDEKPPAKRIFDNYLVPAPREDFYTLASMNWLKQKYYAKICGIDGKKCMFPEDKQAGELKAATLAASPDTLVTGKTIGAPKTYIACQAGTFRS